MHESFHQIGVRQYKYNICSKIPYDKIGRYQPTFIRFLNCPHIGTKCLRNAGHDHSIL